MIVSPTIDGGVRMEENWRDVSDKYPGWNKYFIYLNCETEKGMFCDRTTRDELIGKIPSELQHANLDKIEAYLATQL